LVFAFGFKLSSRNDFEDMHMPPSGKDREELPPAFINSWENSCTECGQVMPARTLAIVVDKKPRCPQCAGIGDLVVLRAGFGELTKLASSYSRKKYAIVEWSSVYERWTRIGVLVEQQAAARAGSQLQEKLQRVTDEQVSANCASFGPPITDRQ
jgi:hypothetical protein